MDRIRDFHDYALHKFTFTFVCAGLQNDTLRPSNATALCIEVVGLSVQ